MKTTTKLYIHKSPYSGGFDVFLSDMTEYGNVLLDTVDVEIEFTVPSEREMVAREVAMLKTEQNRINGEAYAKNKALQDRIDSLLCIECKQEVAA